MSIDLRHEQTMSLNQAAGLLPPGRRGSRVTLSCVLRWVLDGLRGPDGQRVRLEAVRLGARWVTSAEALARFAERLTPKFATGEEPAPAPRTPGRRQKASERAAEALEQLGM